MFASGKYARAECERCGHEFDYDELQEETVRGIPQKNAICGTCFDADHPQNWYGQDVHVDHEGLQDPRPDHNLNFARTLFGWSPVGAAGNRIRLSSGKVSVSV